MSVYARLAAALRLLRPAPDARGLDGRGDRPGVPEEARDEPSARSVLTVERNRCGSYTFSGRAGDGRLCIAEAECMVEAAIACRHLLWRRAMSQAIRATRELNEALYATVAARIAACRDHHPPETAHADH